MAISLTRAPTFTMPVCVSVGVLPAPLIVNETMLPSAVPT